MAGDVLVRIRALGKEYRRGGEAVPVLSGQEAVINYRLESPRPLRMEFRYSRAADMVIHSITLTRME